MKKWKSYLKSDPTDWLLEEKNPSVRYFTLRNLLGKKEDDEEVQEARSAIMGSKTVLKVLGNQDAEGHWG